MAVFMHYIPKATPEQTSIILETIQNVIEELPKKGLNYVEKFTERFKVWFEETISYLLNHDDLHIAHDTLELLEKIFSLENTEEVLKLFNGSEKSHIAIKKMITSTKPDFLKFSNFL